MEGSNEPDVTERMEPSAKLSVKVTRESLLPRADMLLISMERNITKEMKSGKWLG